MPVRRIWRISNCKHLGIGHGRTWLLSLLSFTQVICNLPYLILQLGNHLGIYYSRTPHFTYELISDLHKVLEGLSSLRIVFLDSVFQEQLGRWDKHLCGCLEGMILSQIKKSGRVLIVSMIRSSSLIYWLVLLPWEIGVVSPPRIVGF